MFQSAGCVHKGAVMSFFNRSCMYLCTLYSRAVLTGEKTAPMNPLSYRLYVKKCVEISICSSVYVYKLCYNTLFCHASMIFIWTLGVKSNIKSIRFLDTSQNTYSNYYLWCILYSNILSYAIFRTVITIYGGVFDAVIK